MGNPEIFVSYAWKGESEALVDQLCTAFAAKGYQILRDKSTMTYRDSIKNFMDRIGRGKFIIAVIGDKYMKSEYCMYEAYRMFQSPAFRERVFPLVLPDADIFSFRGQISYLKYWQQEYQALESEYKEIAESSPTMVAPLTERLRDIEATTRFINDFMAAVGDMNVLTSQFHAESNFSQLLQAIENRIQFAEQGTDRGDTSISSNATRENAYKKETEMKEDRKIDTGGGAYVGGGVNTGGGDFVGRDKNTSVSIGGNVNGSNIVLGDHNIVTTSDTKNAFAPVYHAIEQSNLPAQDKTDVEAEVKEIESEIGKAGQANEASITRHLRNVGRMAPEILEVILATFGNPAAGLGLVAKKIADKMKAGL
jgi:hypothetical protein